MADDKKDERPKPSLPKTPAVSNDQVVVNVDAEALAKQAIEDPEADILTIGDLSATENVAERASVDDLIGSQSTDYADLEGTPITPWQAQTSPDKFLIKAKRMVIEFMITTGQTPKRLKPAELNIVWFSKTLQNWKALISTVHKDGLYFEITYNGHLGETYVDVYQKLNNIVIPD